MTLREVKYELWRSKCIKLLHTEPKRGSTHLFYIAGSRVVHYMERAYSSERALTKLLSVAMDEHKDAVENLQKSNRLAAKTTRGHLREIALLLAHSHLSSPSPEPFMCIHRDDGDTEFMNTLGNELAPKGVFVFVTVGGKKGAGQFLLAGSDEDVATLGPKVADFLGGKGGGRKGRYQGKAGRMENCKQALDFVRDTLAAKKETS
jgi:misacylated tRNA(Ala) deacylase